MKLNFVLAPVAEGPEKDQTMQVSDLLELLGFQRQCFEMVPCVSCRCVAALGISRGHLCWRLGCELPALLPDGEDAFPVPLPACPHIPDSPDSHRIAASWRSSLQVFGFHRWVTRQVVQLFAPGLSQRKQ